MENKIIELLMQELAVLRAENKELLEIIKNYSKQETKITNDIKVNSYNGSTAFAEGGEGGNGGTHSQNNNHVDKQNAHNLTNGSGAVNENKL